MTPIATPTSSQTLPLIVAPDPTQRPSGSQESEDGEPNPPPPISPYLFLFLFGLLFFTSGFGLQVALSVASIGGGPP